MGEVLTDLSKTTFGAGFAKECGARKHELLEKRNKRYPHKMLRHFSFPSGRTATVREAVDKRLRRRLPILPH